MMKKTTKILVVAVSFILLLSVLIFGSSAEEAPEASAVDGTPVFEVKYQDGRSEYFYTWKSTLAATEDNCIITKADKKIILACKSSEIPENIKSIGNCIRTTHNPLVKTAHMPIYCHCFLTS